MVKREEAAGGDQGSPAAPDTADIAVQSASLTPASARSLLPDDDGGDTGQNHDDADGDQTIDLQDDEEAAAAAAAAAAAVPDEEEEEEEEEDDHDDDDDVASFAGAVFCLGGTLSAARAVCQGANYIAVAWVEVFYSGRWSSIT
jgi:hypothetical protein